MIRNPLALRLDPERPVREQIQESARLGARGVVVDAIGDLAPHRLGETGRREVRHILRSVELKLAAVSLPTRRPFDTTDLLDDRLKRADAACAMAFELGTDVVLVRVGSLPPEDDARRPIFTDAVRELARRADHRGVRLAVETGTESGTTLRAFLASLGVPALAASLDPSAMLQAGLDPVAATRELGAEWVAHAYAADATSASRIAAPNPRGHGFPPGALDWEEYLGALEEIGYHNFLTVWPPAGRTAAAHFAAIVARLNELG